METSNYRSILNEELAFRSKENPSYSLRAFSRDLSIAPSQLSEILKGKTGLSSNKSMLIASKLGLSDQDCLVFKAMVEVEHGRSQKIKEAAKEFLEKNKHSEDFKSLSLDGFKIISEWYYFAILSVMELDLYDGSTNFIAKALSLEIALVEDCVKRLLKLDIIDLKSGKFIPTGEMFATTTDIQSRALQKFHKGHLQKSIYALEKVDVTKRDITSMTMAIDPQKLPEAKNLIKKFRRDLCEFLEKDEKKEVYNLNIQLIPLSTQERV